MTRETQLVDLRDKKISILLEIEDFINEHKTELIKEICEMFNLDAKKNEVSISSGTLRNPRFFYKDDSEFHRTHIVYLGMNGWEERN